MPQGEELLADEGQRERVEEELAAIERSAAFVRSPVMRRLLRFIDGESMAGRGAQIKSYTLAVDGLGRAEDFDAQQDSYPPVQIGRLRKALEGYYRHTASVSGLRLELRHGSYEIHFVEASRHQGGKKVAGAAGARLATSKSFVRSLRHLPGWGWALLLVMAIVGALTAGGWTRGFLAPWYLDSENSANAEDAEFPLLDISPVVNGQPGTESDDFASFLTFRLTDAIRRSGWIKVRSASAADQRLPYDVKADFQLRSRVYTHDDGDVLSMELVDLDEGLIIWTRDVPLKRGADKSVTGIQPILVGLASSLVAPGGVIAERMLQKDEDAGRQSDYSCMIQAFEFKTRRSASGYEAARGCLLAVLKSNPRQSRAWALLAELEQDNVDFRYKGSKAGSSAEAMTMARRAVDIGPRDAMARYVLAFLQYRAGDYVHARENALKSLEANPYSSAVLTRNGNLLFFMGDKYGLDLVQQALETDPDPAPWFRQPLFFDAFANGRTAEAVAQASAMRDLQGKGRAYLFAIRALAAAMQGRISSSARAARTARRCGARPTGGPYSAPTISTWEFASAFAT